MQTAGTEPRGDHPTWIRGHISRLSPASAHHKGAFNLLRKYKAALDGALSDCLSQISQVECLILFPKDFLLQETTTSHSCSSSYINRLCWNCLFSNTEISHKFGLNYQKVFSGNHLQIDQFSILCACSNSCMQFSPLPKGHKAISPSHIRMQQLLNSRAHWSSACTSDTHSQDTWTFIFCFNLLV